MGSLFFLMKQYFCQVSHRVALKVSKLTNLMALMLNKMERATPAFYFIASHGFELLLCVSTFCDL